LNQSAARFDSETDFAIPTLESGRIKNHNKIPSASNIRRIHSNNHKAHYLRQQMTNQEQWHDPNMGIAKLTFSVW
jgi:hypothetical protein